MTLLGTSYEGSGNFYGNKARQMGEALSLITAKMEDRRLKKEAQEQRELEKFFSAVSQEPSLVDTWGKDIERKYGQKYGEVAPLMDAIRKRYELAKFVPASGEKWDAKLVELEQAHERKGAELQAMPDMIPGAYAGPFGAMDLPNVYKQQESASYGQVDPAYFPYMALQEMTPKERRAARLYAKQNGEDIQTPAAFDPFGDDLPADIKAVFAAQEGYLTGDTAKAARVKSQLEQSPAKLQSQEFSVSDREDRQANKADEREEREEFTTAEREARDKAAIARERIRNSLAIARDNARTANDKSLITYRESFDEDGEENGTAVVNWKSLEADSKAAQKDYDEELSQTMRGVPAGTKASEVKADFMKNRGSRPRALSESQARRVAKELKRRIDSGELSADEAEEASSEIVADYMSKTAVGVAPEVALKQALDPESVPETVPITRQAPAWAENALPTDEADPDALIDGEEKPVARRGTVATPATPVKPKAKAPDRASLKAQAKREHPDWTPKQIDAAVDAYLSAKGAQ